MISASVSLVNHAIPVCKLLVAVTLERAVFKMRCCYASKMVNRAIGDPLCSSHSSYKGTQDLEIYQTKCTARGTEKSSLLVALLQSVLLDKKIRADKMVQ